jgi:hypothetical protein
MSVPFGSAVLTLDDITKQIRNTFEQFTALIIVPAKTL